MRISDWSSDVCSSDLYTVELAPLQSYDAGQVRIVHQTPIRPPRWIDICLASGECSVAGQKIGRASCRDRVCQYVYISVVAVSFNTKHTSREPTHQSLSINNDLPPTTPIITASY